MSDIVPLHALPQGNINRINNGTFNACPEGTTSGADATPCFLYYTRLSQSAAVQTSQLSAPNPNMARAIRLTQTSATPQRIGLSQTIPSISVQALRNSPLTLSYWTRYSTDRARLMFALLQWDGTADGAPADPINDWTSTSYIPGSFFSSSVTVLNYGYLANDANTWTPAPYIPFQAGASANNLIMVVWTEEAIAQNATVDLGLWQVIPGAEQLQFANPSALDIIDDGGGLINVRAFGARGNSIRNTSTGAITAGTNDTAAINRALAVAQFIWTATGNSPTVYFPPGIYAHTGLTVTDYGVVLKGDNACLARTANTIGLSVVMSWSNIQSISAISTQSIQLSEPIPTDLTPVSRLTVTDASAYAVDQYVKVVSNNMITSVISGNEREGEFARIAQIDTGNNYLYLYSVLEFAANYTDTPRVARMNSSPYIEINGLEFNYVDTMLSATTDEVKINSSFRSRFIKVTIPRSLFLCFKTNSTLEAYFEDCYFANVSQNGAGYGLIEGSSEYTTISGLHGTHVRHLVTSGVGSTAPGSSVIENFGRTKYQNVNHVIAWNCWKEAIDTHPDGYRNQFRDCMVRDAYVGPAGGRNNYNIEGIGNRLFDCGSIGGGGYVLNNTQANAPAGCQDNEIHNSWHEFSSQATDEVAFTVKATGTGTPISRGNRIVNPTVYTNETLALPFLVSGQIECTIVQPEIYAPRTDAGTSYEFKINDYAIMRIVGGRVHYDGSSTTDCRIYLLNGNDGTIYSAGPFQIITGGASVGRLINLGAGNSNAYLDVTCDGTIVAEVSGTTTGTYYRRLLDGFSTVSCGTARTHTIATGAITLQSPNVILATEGGGATDDLDTINGGAEGDIIYIRSSNSSQDPTLKDGTGNLLLAGDFTLSNTADRIQLMKTGSNWVELSRSDNA